MLLGSSFHCGNAGRGSGCFEKSRRNEPGGPGRALVSKEEIGPSDGLPKISSISRSSPNVWSKRVSAAFFGRGAPSILGPLFPRGNDVGKVDSRDWGNLMLRMLGKEAGRSGDLEQMPEVGLLLAKLL